jgi:hypothetical protein
VKQDKMVRVVMKMEKKENRRSVATAGYEKGEAAAAASKMMAKDERNVAKAEQKMVKAAAAKVARVGQKMAKAEAEEEKAGQTGPLAEATAAAATVEPSAAHSCIKKSSSAASDAVIIDVGPEVTVSRVCTQLPVTSSYPSYPLISVVRNLQAQPSPPPVNIMAAKGYAVFLPDGPNVDITDVSTRVFDKIFFLPSVPDPGSGSVPF